MTITAPVGATMPEIIRRHAVDQPEAPACTFLIDGEQEGEKYTYRQIDELSRGIAATILTRLRAGDRALLLLPNCEDFAPAFLGCLAAGIVAVPAYPPTPPQMDQRLETLRAISRDCQPSMVITSLTPDQMAMARTVIPELADAWWASIHDLKTASNGMIESTPDAVDLAFLQYTSGSTGVPKGVMITHGQLVHQERMIQRASGNELGFTGVGWLPMFHDMGLIGQLLQPLFLRGHIVMMSPLDFLKRPARWLRAISTYGATASAGPNFAYDLCVRRITDEECEGLDLSAWRMALSGAEPVRAATLDAFADRFGRYGFESTAFFPAYGLAESTLLVTGGPVGQPRRLIADTAALAQDRVIPATQGRTLVSCGHAHLDRDVRIVDAISRIPLPDGWIGEIWIAGADVASGYWRRPEQTDDTFGARLATGEGPFLRSGDLGFRWEDEFYVTGRLKDLIVVDGRNHYPQDIEATVTEAEPTIQPGAVAAFSVENGDAEQVVIVASVKRDQDPALARDRVTRTLRSKIAAAHGITVGDVALVPADTVPRTSSGKIRRAVCRAAYLDGKYSTEKGALQ